MHDSLCMNIVFCTFTLNVDDTCKVSIYCKRIRNVNVVCSTNIIVINICRQINKQWTNQRPARVTTKHTLWNFICSGIKNEHEIYYNNKDMTWQAVHLYDSSKPYYGHITSEAWLHASQGKGWLCSMHPWWRHHIDLGCMLVFQEKVSRAQGRRRGIEYKIHERRVNADLTGLGVKDNPYQYMYIA